MPLRKSIADAIKERLRTSLPDAIKSLWDIEPVSVAMEQLTFTHVDEAGEILRHCGDFQGVVRLNLVADEVDDFTLDYLIIGLLAKPLQIDLPVGMEIEQICPRAKLTLLDQRDGFNDQTAITSLRFNITGGYYERVEAVTRLEMTHA